MTRPLRSTLALGLLMLLPGACHQEQKVGHGLVSGAILPGSVSDAMLPYDAVKSKPPLAPVQVVRKSGYTHGDTAADNSDAPAAANSAAPDAPTSPVPSAAASGGQ